MAVRDVVQAAAGVGGGGEYVEDVFSTYLYTGNGGTQTINNGIDLDGEGGLVWLKNRNGTQYHCLADTIRGPNQLIYTNRTNASGDRPNSLTSFNSNGFSLGSETDTNQTGNTYASWSFRKSPKFFDVVTYTGNGVNGRAISHSLGSTPGCVIVKRTNTTGDWAVYHRGLTSAGYYVQLNNNNAESAASSVWASTAPTDAVFTVGSASVVNASGSTYVAYIFAHDAGGFGDDGEQNVISCGSFTTDGSGNATVNLGYEPQWVMNKTSVGTADNWLITDTMRGASHTSAGFLFANLSNAEGVAGYEYNTPTANGFNVRNHSSSTTYIYIAIRRPMKTPESGTEVFAIDNMTNATTAPPGLISGFPVDFAIEYQNVASGSSANTRTTTRLLGQTHLQTSSSAAEVVNTDHKTDYQNGFYDYTGTISNFYAHMFRRAPSFMDVVAYTGGTGTPRVLNHNLTVPPELVITKVRNYTGEDWVVHYNNGSSIIGGYLNSTSAFANSSTAPSTDITSLTSTTYTLNTSNRRVNAAYNYIAYLFASCPGVSKVGSYTGTGADLNVDCGFSSGARFVLIKRTDSTGDWYVWDSLRGIVAGNDPYLLLNSTAGQNTSTDYIDPLASGFTVTSSAPAALNASGGSYIFLAIA